MRHMQRSLLAAGLCLMAWLACGPRAPAAEAVTRAEELLPGDAVFLLSVPDLSAARAAAAKSRLAEMCAQPELQAFLQPPCAKLKQTYAELRAKNPLLPALEDLDTGLLSGEVAVGLYARPQDQNIPVGLTATLAPKDGAAFLRLLPPGLREQLGRGNPMPLGPEPEAPAAVWSGGRLVLCFPQADLPGVLARLKDPAARAKTLAAAPAFIAARGRLSASAAWLYVSPQRALETATSVADAMHDPDAMQVMMALRALGLGDLAAASFGLGFGEGQPVLESCLSFAGAPKEGFFSLCADATPIGPAGLKIAAPDAPYVCASHFQFAGLLPAIRQAVQKVNPNAVQDFDNALAQAAQSLQFDPQKDLLENLGGEVVTVQTALDTAAPLSLWPGLACGIPVKDPAKMEGCLVKIEAFLTQINTVTAAQPWGGLAQAEFRRVAYRGKVIHYLRSLWVGPFAFCVAGDRLLAATSVNALRRTLEQLEQPQDILSNADFQQTLARLSGKPFQAAALPASFAYAVDRGSGTGTLLITGLGLLSATGALAGLAEMPPPGPIAGNLFAYEHAAMRACRAYAEAQDIYRRTDWNEDGVLEYAQAFTGANSLYEKTPGQGDLLLIDREMAEAGGEPGGKASKNGYRFKMFTGQGPDAPGGQKSYMVNGRQTIGYSLVAYPLEYGVTGKKTFLINNTGTVWAKDLGAKTAELVAQMSAYNTDKTWVVTEDLGGEVARGGDPLKSFLNSPGGKAAFGVAKTVDLALWPDEGFFIKYRRPTGSVAVPAADGIYWRCELPPPAPGANVGASPLVMVSGVAILAAIAIPNLLRVREAAAPPPEALQPAPAQQPPVPNQPNPRMAANEAAAAAACLAFAEAEDIYRRTDWNADGVLEYAQSIRGDFSLYERTAGKADVQLVDTAFADAVGNPGQVKAPRNGYCFKVLKGQGPQAPGGQKSYLVNGRMTIGYAVVAYPAQYGKTGRKTFVINNMGTVHECDLGAQTGAIVEKMTEYNPDPKQGWTPYNPETKQQQRLAPAEF